MRIAYRLSQTLLAARLGQEGRGEIVRIPAGGVLDVLGLTGIPGFVEVRWEGDRYSVFEEDLADRAIKVLDAAV